LLANKAAITDIAYRSFDLGRSSSITTTEKRRAACRSCHDAKLKCGPNSKTQACEYRVQSNPTITSFFASVTSHNTNADIQ
ncbi:hypothetical protein F441_22561, partial [Phytophthora nicotianae CJ01A1]